MVYAVARQSIKLIRHGRSGRGVPETHSLSMASLPVRGGQFLVTQMSAVAEAAIREASVGSRASDLKIAVLIPCYNEESTVAAVVAGFSRSLPGATVYVFDNNSTDGTIAEARAAGAIVRSERLQGKGHVVRRMFADVEADVYVMVDGDDTYDPE